MIGHKTLIEKLIQLPGCFDFQERGGSLNCYLVLQRSLPLVTFHPGGTPQDFIAQLQQTDPKPVALDLEDVRLDIPVFTTETRSLKASLIRSVTGGKLSRRGGGAIVTALQDITCTIREGDRVALIGHNGAGKSSFLRLVSGIYQHTGGRFEAHVPVFPMIHKSFITSSELSGMQAIKAHYLLVHGNLRGFDAFCDDVVTFSGLGDFVQLPVKTYSQGMAARLLFAVLTAGSHDCLAMDEGFGAGDSSFFQKAQERMHGFLATAGTLLLASHSDPLLRQFCHRGLVFSEGSIVFDGSLEDALTFYHQTAD